MKEQNVQGESLERRSSFLESQHDQHDHQSLLSSPRHSELSLLSDSTGQRESHFGASHQSKDVRDPNFIQNRQRQERRDQDATSKLQWHHEIFTPSIDAPQSMYQTQQQTKITNVSPLGQTLGTKILADRLSQIMARQSYPEAPITDRKLESMHYRDSMIAARQGLQGAGNGGSVVQNAPYQPLNKRIYSAMTNSVTNDHLSSIQFILSQSDRDGTQIMSQNNYINVLDGNGDQDNSRLPLNLQWSLTNSVGLESQETESQAKQIQLQNFYSPVSVEPTGGIRSEDYHSQFNSASLANLSEAVNLHQFLRHGEHSKPIMVNNSMTPMAAPSFKILPNELDSGLKKPRPKNESEYDNILSSPSEQVDELTEQDLSATQSSRVQGNLRLVSLRVSNEQISVISPSKIIKMKSPKGKDCPSSLRIRRIESPDQRHDRSSRPSHQTLQDERISSSQALNFLSPQQAKIRGVNQSQEQEKPIVSSTNNNKTALNSENQLEHHSQKESNEECQKSSNQEEEDEDCTAMISVRGGNLHTMPQSDLFTGSNNEEEFKRMLINDKNSHDFEKCRSEKRTVEFSGKLPLPNELFNDNRTSEFEQPIMSAKTALPNQIFGEMRDYGDFDASEFQLESLESKAKLANNNSIPTIDYKNLPINVSNLLLQQATSYGNKGDRIARYKKDADSILDMSPHEPRLQIVQTVKPIISTDQHMREDFQSSSMSKGFNSLESNESIEERQDEMKAEELERNPVNQDSSTISLSQIKPESDRFNEVADLSKNHLMTRKDFLTDSKRNSINEESEMISCLISRQTSQVESDQSASLMFSQTNNDRMTLTSMAFTQEKQYPNQPTTSRKHHQRGQQFPQTSEKKDSMTLKNQRQTMPSGIFAASQSNAVNGIGRQQSCSSLNNTTLREGNSSTSHQSYLVNALGQRISSGVSINQMHPADVALQKLIGNKTNIMGPVLEFGGETMSTIPDESLPHREVQNQENFQTADLMQNYPMGYEGQLMRNRVQETDQYYIQVGLKEQSAPGYPSTTRQSVTEINFNSVGDNGLSYNHTSVHNTKDFSDINNGNNAPSTRQMTQVEQTRLDKEDKISVKRNLNLLEAFRTQTIPDKIHIQDETKHQMDDSESSSTQQQLILQQEEADEENKNDLNEAELAQSNPRLFQIKEDLPVFKSHENMGRVNAAANGTYSLEAQHIFYQRLNSIKAGQNAFNQKAPSHIKSHSVQVVRRQEEYGYMGDATDQASNACSVCILNGDDGHCKGQQQQALMIANRFQSEGRSTPDDNDQSENDHQDYQRDSNIEEAQQNQTQHVTQEYFAEEHQNNHVSNTECIDDFLTDDDIAIFRSQLNDIPANFAQEPIRKQLTTNISMLQQRHETTFLLSIEETDPLRIIMAKSNSKSKSKRSRGFSLSTNQATEDENTGNGGIDDRLSPKFEKLMQLQTNPSRQEHIKRPKAAGHQPNLMLRTIDPTRDGGIVSPPLASTTTTKSFLHRIVNQQGFNEQMAETEKQQITIPQSSKYQKKLQIKTYSVTVNQSSGAVQSQENTTIASDGGPRPKESVGVSRDCLTTTHQEAKKRATLMSGLYHDERGFPGASQTTNNLEVKHNNVQRHRSQNRNQEQQPTTTQFMSKTATEMCRTQQTLPSRQTESVPRDLSLWLSSLSLSQYGLLLVEQGLDDLQSLVLMMSQDRVLPLTHEILEEAGINISGHRARILVNLELEAGAFLQNIEILELLQNSTISHEEIARQADYLFDNGPASQSDHQAPSNHRSEKNSNRQTPDESRFGASPVSHSPLTEQILRGRADRSPLRPQMTSNKLLGSLSLSNWLQKNNLLFLQPKFIRSGYECLRSLILQSFSQFNKLTDETLKTEIGIEKIGHRLRILSQLRQDALILFQMELLYRSAKDSSKPGPNQDDSLFVLPGRQKRHFKSVFSDTQNKNDSMTQQPQHTQSQQYILPNNSQNPHHHMSQQQLSNKKVRPLNYSFSKIANSESVPSSQQTSYRQYQQQVPSHALSRQKTTQNQNIQQRQNHGQKQDQEKEDFSYIKDHIESNLNPWRHSTYFDQSRPVTGSQNSHYEKLSNQSLSQHPFLPASTKQKSGSEGNTLPDSDKPKMTDAQIAQLLQYQRQLRETLDEKQRNAKSGLPQPLGIQSHYIKQKKAQAAQYQAANVDKSCIIF